MTILDSEQDGQEARSQAPGQQYKRPDHGGNVAQATIAAVRSMIHDELRPGDLLPPQRDLARALNVSRATLREALSILATLGEIVPKENGRGFLCADPTETPATPSWRFAARYPLTEVYQFRYVVESYAAELAAISHTGDEIETLRGTIVAFRKAALAEDLMAYVQADFDFHHLVMSIGRNKLLVDMHQTFASVLLESQRLIAGRRGNLLIAVQEHDHILQAIAMRDPDGARYYMRKHLSMAASRAGLPLSEVP